MEMELLLMLNEKKASFNNKKKGKRYHKKG